MVNGMNRKISKDEVEGTAEEEDEDQEVERDMWDVIRNKIWEIHRIQIQHQCILSRRMLLRLQWRMNGISIRMETRMDSHSNSWEDQDIRKGRNENEMVQRFALEICRLIEE